jgi:hypothetical protein
LLREFVDNQDRFWYKCVQCLSAAPALANPRFESHAVCEAQDAKIAGILGLLPNLTGGVAAEQLVNADRKAFVERAKLLMRELGVE